ncbi:hypothetical protein SLS62_007004 [Diatrype stigma]|uniref:N-acetyltransferase domain-containing protein n=1 Tax=Diatrype stigma TaxID=117547 RepID=A0AAN9UXG8_9PEZI
MSSRSMITDGFATAFKSKRLIYRAFENNEHDKNFLHQIENDPVAAALSTPSKVRPRSTKSTEWVAESLSKSVLAVMVCLPPPGHSGAFSGEGEELSATREPPTPIGYVVLGWAGADGPLDQSHHRTIGVGIALAAPYRDGGYGGEALDWALDWAFRHGGYRRVELSTVAFNERALHLYRRLGFVEEGRRRQAHWHDRRWWDLVDFGMLEDEWAARRGVSEEGEGGGGKAEI